MDDWTQPFIPTSYDNSPMAKDRVEVLQNAEREYINGVSDEEGNVEWPTYRGLAEKHAIPVRVINEQAKKHRWNARRDKRRGELVYFKQQQQMRAWQDMDREYTVRATESLNKLQFVVERKAHEMYYEALSAHAQDAENAHKGNREIAEMKVKMTDLKDLTKTVKDLNEAQAARATRAQALPLGYNDVQAPAELPTATEEQGQLETHEAAKLTGVDEVLRLMVETQNRYFSQLDDRVIEGTVLDDD